ncbi:CRISPR-associated protein Cas4 [Methanosphaera sp.]
MKSYELKYNYPKGRNHPTIKQVKIFNNTPNFPISWLNTQNFCEYSIYLENFQHIEVEATEAMLKGTEVHNKLEKEFKKDAVKMSMDEILMESETHEVVSREFFVINEEFGIRGYIDEIQFNKGTIIIIDDKPGTKAYRSMINQVFAYCLSFKYSVDKDMKIFGALRNRDTGEVFWQEEFTHDEEENIKEVIQHVQNLIKGVDDFIPTKNPNKCRSCRFNTNCPNAQ